VNKADRYEEDRKAKAREIRLAARKEKKKIKGDAKRQRKENAVMNRRMVLPPLSPSSKKPNL